MKYTKKPPVITLTEDDVELVADKVQDRGEDVVHTVEAQREEIMVKLVDFHDTLQRMHIFTVQQATTSSQKRHNNPLHRRNKRKQWR
jgi:hypothetical protein